MSDDRCPCGRPLHYDSPAEERLVEGLIRELGEFVDVNTGRGIWRVPRRWVAMHGRNVAEFRAQGFRQLSTV